MKMAVFWVVVPCSFVEIDRHFTSAYFLHHQALMTSETSVNFCDTTCRNIPEDTHLKMIKVICWMFNTFKNKHWRQKKEFKIDFFVLQAQCAVLENAFPIENSYTPTEERIKKSLMRV
jgi:hypothetical protein